MEKSSSWALLALLGIILIGLSSPVLSGKNKLSYDGQIRLRNEFDLKTVEPERHSQTFHDLRTRLGFKFEPNRRTTVYVQLQDSRRLGDPSSGDLSASDNVDIHQAFFEIEDAIARNLWFKAGRFELNYGNQRIFGSVGWHNIGRSWEGGVASIREDKYRVDLFYLKRMEMNDEDYNRDFDVYGIYSSIYSLHLDLFWFYESDSDTNNYFEKKLRRYNLGFYYENTYKEFDFIAQSNYQYGEKPWEEYNPLIQDISAYMFNAELGYSFYGELPGRIAAGIDYTSGDKLYENDEINSYTDAYYTGHKFRGYMDYFVGSQAYGLVDKMIRLKLEPPKGWKLGADLHFFSAPKYNYSDGPYYEARTTNLGTEIDLTASTKSAKGVTLTGGVSVFFPTDEFSPAIDNNRDGFWTYLMTTVDF